MFFYYQIQPMVVQMQLGRSPTNMGQPDPNQLFTPKTRILNQMINYHHRVSWAPRTSKRKTSQNLHQNPLPENIIYQEYQKTAIATHRNTLIKTLKKRIKTQSSGTFFSDNCSNLS